MTVNTSIIIDWISHYWDVMRFYVPIGIIGAWRWGVWLIRKSIAQYYSLPKGNYNSTLSVVTPVYNEDPAMFKLALQSWADNQPEEIIAVIDYSDKQSIEIFNNFAKKYPGAKLIITQTPGKRPALAEGVKAAKSDIVALVDSDTTWTPNIKSRLLGPFADDKVGGVGTRQDVLETNSIARKLFKMRLDDRYFTELTYLSVLGNALTCLSGRTAVYRRKAILTLVDEMNKETFLGDPVISGDDKTLTRLVQAAGWKVKYIADVRVYTPGARGIIDYFKQQLRWTRNSFRSDLKTLTSSWVWKREKFLALHMADRFIQPFTLLLGPIYFAVSLLFGFWKFAAILLGWWLVSRAIKLYPHLKEKPSDIFMLPIYLVATYVVGVVKIYALLTLNEQGWITRWSKERLSRFSLVRESLSMSATFTLIFGLFFVVSQYKITTLEAAEIAEANKIITAHMKKVAVELKLKQDFGTYVQVADSQAPLVDAATIETKDSLIQKATNDPFGYYVIKQGDTTPVLAKRYNLSSSAKILTADGRLPANQFFLRAGRMVAIPVNELRRPLDKSILFQSLVLPTVSYIPAENTIYVRKGGSTVNLTRIQQALPLSQRNLLAQVSPGEWILRANLYIGKNVTLVLDGQEVKYLKMKSDDTGFIWMRSESGNILISDTKVTSWNESTNAPDMIDKDGRAYITAKNSGRMDILRSEMAYLGYEGLPKRGGLFGGSYGVSWKIKNNGFRDALLTGVILDSSFHHNYFGVYTYGATGMLIRGNKFHENVQYGLDPHDDSNNFLVENNEAFGNGNHGIIFSRRCFDNIIRNNVSHDNRLHGIMLDRTSNNNLVENNTVYNNVDGLALYDSHENIILDNIIEGNIRGIRMNVNSSGNYVEKNNVEKNQYGFFFYDGAQRNIAIDNSVRQNEIGVTLKTASNNKLFYNLQLGENTKAGRITLDSHDNSIR